MAEVAGCTRLNERCTPARPCALCRRYAEEQAALGRRVAARVKLARAAFAAGVKRREDGAPWPELSPLTPAERRVVCRLVNREVVWRCTRPEVLHGVPPGMRRYAR